MHFYSYLVDVLPFGDDMSILIYHTVSESLSIDVDIFESKAMTTLVEVWIAILIEDG
jgi:hypothetical protein